MLIAIVISLSLILYWSPVVPVLDKHFVTNVNNNMCFHYTRQQLLEHRSIQGRLSDDVVCTIKHFDIWRRRRGKRAGRRKQRPIPTIAWRHGSTQPRTRRVGADTTNLCKLQQVSRSALGHTMLTKPLLHTKTTTTTTTTTGLILLNARSVCNKASAIRDYIVDSNSDIIAITETWVNASKEKLVTSELVPQGFSIVHAPRPRGRGGGIAVVYRDTLRAKRLKPTQVPTTFEVLELVLTQKAHSLKLITVYRPPPSTANKLTAADFQREFADFLSQQVEVKSNLLVIGDFNIQWDSPDNPDTKNLGDTLDSHSFAQHVVGATHKDGHTIDLVMSRSSDNIIASVSVSSLVTDHHAIQCSLRMSKPPLPTKTVTSRIYKQLDHHALMSDIQDSELLCNPSPDLDTLCTQYNSALKSALDRHAPEKTRTVTVRSHTEWMNDSILAEKRRRRQYERLWVASKLEVHHQMYKQQRDFVNSLIRQAKVKHYESKVLECGTNQKKLFQIVQSLMDPKAETATSLSAEAFSSYFITKISTIRDTFDSTDITTSEGAAPGVTLSQFTPFSEGDLSKIVLASPAKTCKLDPWPTWLLKEHLHVLLPTLTHIVNESLSNGQFPSEMKHALVTPLLKKASLDPDLPKNFRPVSNLSFLSKVMERAVAHQLGKYLDDNSMHHPFQSAYRAHHSVETALLKVNNDIMIALDQQEGVILILLDLSAAFDTVDHDILISRLQTRFGISGKVLDWLKTYLVGRDQAVVKGGETADPRVVECGVPQGSVLGPVLFSLYISPLGDIAAERCINTHQYADDSQLYITYKLSSPPSSNTALGNIEECVCDIKAWMCCNKLKLNDDKTEVLFITSPHLQKKTPFSSVHVGSLDIPSNTAAGNLGSVFDQTMRMERHVNKICTSCFLHLRNISAIRNSLTREATEKLIHAFISSRLDNCNSLLYDLPSVLLTKLQRVQNTAARIVTKSSKYENITAVLKDLHWLPVKQRIQFKIITITWKALYDQAPSYIKDLIQPYTPSRELRSSHKHQLAVPRYHRSHGGRAYSVAAPTLWNALPCTLKELNCYETFKTHLKTLLFKEAYGL